MKVQFQAAPCPLSIIPSIAFVQGKPSIIPTILALISLTVRASTAGRYSASSSGDNQDQHPVPSNAMIGMWTTYFSFRPYSTGSSTTGLLSDAVHGDLKKVTSLTTYFSITRDLRDFGHTLACDTEGKHGILTKSDQSSLEQRLGGTRAQTQRDTISNEALEKLTDAVHKSRAPKIL
ncbi:hypothetical protein BLNAU_6780 [Blattamonas nauphoetae]|uniref:Uncharacterized protein n=1 Tax=Blattamonas nauphoetae TaxID=2049346 RepID=A0ABQ9Y3H6_9EUKA|nr:hypothetical protein BLNAU_6780 [Blattamonas nauphoetae]